MAMIKVPTKMTSAYPNSTEKQQNNQKTIKNKKKQNKEDSNNKKHNKNGRVYIVKNRLGMMKNAE